MNTLLIFFALPLATIILAIVLQKLIKCPVLVAAIFFAIYLIVAFAAFDTTFLIAVIVYTFLAYVTASIVKMICCFIRNSNCGENNGICSGSVNSNDTIVLNNLDTVTLSNSNSANCTISCNNNTRNNIFNNGYNRGYNNGYDNGYNNAVNFLGDNSNEQTISNNSGCSCRRRCR